MALCTACGKDLEIRIERPDEGLASCPGCSRRAGEHIYYAVTHFAWSNCAGKPVSMSYCFRCRPGGAGPNGVRCED